MTSVPELATFATKLIGRGPVPPGTTHTHLTYISLRERIVAGNLAPGSKLNIAQLAAELSVSPGAVREALAMLEAEALVASEPQRGFSVMPLTLDDVLALTEARVEIEKLCLSSAIAHGDIEWESAVVGALHRLNRIEGQAETVGRMSPEWTEAHKELHRALASGCPNPWLLRVRELLYQQSERYRQVSAPGVKGVRDVTGEHRKLVETALSRDQQHVCRLIELHLSRTTELVREALLIRDRKQDRSEHAHNP